ncbi:MAG TPA: hypothetical protein VM912_20375, partial [Terriglobales bacterium]|nr:hypothetical protein [Terriglobales bacterium]
VPAILIALEYLVIVAVAAISGAIASYGPGLQVSDPAVRRNSLRAVAVAVWMAPLMLLFLERSAIAGFVAAGMVLGGCTLLQIPARSRPDATSCSVSGTAGLRPAFLVTRTWPFVKQLTRAILSSAMLQTAVLANLIYKRELALLLFVLGAALIAGQLRGAADESTDQPQTASPQRYLLPSAAVATIVIVIGLLPLLVSLGQRSDFLEAVFRKLVLGGTSGQVVANRSVRLEQTRIRSDGYIGVILTPKPPKTNPVSAPSEISFGGSEPNLMRPLAIPFTGSYWFFQFPFVRPPLDSITAEGDPATVGVRSSNYKPLLMEAVQNLYEPINTARLGAIKLAMFDADVFPGTVSVELVLVDAATWDHPAQSLGIQRLDVSTRIENASNSHSENLSFRIPPYPRCHQFSQMRLIFTLDASRSRQAAAIAVQSFLLVPRGT